MDFIEKLKKENKKSVSWLGNEDILVDKAKELFVSAISKFPIISYIPYLPNSDILSRKFIEIYFNEDDIDDMDSNEIGLLSSLLFYYIGSRESKYLIVDKNKGIITEDVENAASKFRNEKILRLDSIVVDLDLLIRAIGFELPEKKFFTDNADNNAYRFIYAYLSSYGRNSAYAFALNLGSRLDVKVDITDDARASDILYFEVDKGKFNVYSSKVNSNCLPLLFK